MPLTIDSERAHQLAIDLAKLTGESLTGAVTRSLEERLEREQHDRKDIGRRAGANRAGASANPGIGEEPKRELDRHEIDRKVKRIMEIVRAAGPAEGASSDHDDLYDERGLPR